eukprot:11390430-Prorocentrum_lima.AAC.1
MAKARAMTPQTINKALSHQQVEQLVQAQKQSLMDQESCRSLGAEFGDIGRVISNDLGAAEA